MSESVKLTEAQRRALREIDIGCVRRYTPWRSHRGPGYKVSSPGKSRTDTIQRVIDTRLAEIGPRDNALFSPVILTAAGREALAASQEAER